MSFPIRNSFLSLPIRGSVLSLPIRGSFLSLPIMDSFLSLPIAENCQRPLLGSEFQSFRSVKAQGPNTALVCGTIKASMMDQATINDPRSGFLQQLDADDGTSYNVCMIQRSIRPLCSPLPSLHRRFSPREHLRSAQETSRLATRSTTT